MLTIIGTILFLLPFLLILKFKNKKIGFAYTLSFIISFHLFVAIITQLLHVFNYPFIIIINVLFSLFVVIKTDWRMFRGSLRACYKKVDWTLIFTIVIIFICLFSVHYNYSGDYSVLPTSQYQVEKNMVYPYPYYADEWYAVSVIKGSIESHSLPTRAPLAPPHWQSNFINLEFVFHSFLAELTLLLNLDLLTDYTILAIFSGLLICLLVYLFLRYCKINKYSAALMSVSVLYLTNGANLPGIWYLIPLTLGILSILLSFFFVVARDKKMLFLMAVITILFYPPLFIFCSLIILFFLFSERSAFKIKMRQALYYLGLVIFSAVFLSLAYLFSQNHPDTFFNYIFSKIVYPTFVTGGTPQYLIHNIIPIPILLLAILGVITLVRARKNNWLLGVFFLGVMYWILYFFVSLRFIIEWQRVIVFTSIITVLVAGFGLEYFIKFLNNFRIFKNNFLNYAQLGVLVLFFVLSFSYTEMDNWQKLKLVHENGNIYLPAAPANKYLHPDDLALFKDIKKQRFLSLDWKGTVIGVATENYPLSTKPGTITIHRKLSSIFMSSDCENKIEIAKHYGISYVYFPAFNCPSFKYIDTSGEGLSLYKVE